MAMNISCKFEKASYNIFFVRAVTVKSLYTLWRRNKVKSIVSTGCYPVDTIIKRYYGFYYHFIICCKNTTMMSIVHMAHNLYFYSLPNAFNFKCPIQQSVSYWD